MSDHRSCPGARARCPARSRLDGADDARAYQEMVGAEALSDARDRDRPAPGRHLPHADDRPRRLRHRQGSAAASWTSLEGERMVWTSALGPGWRPNDPGPDGLRRLPVHRDHELRGRRPAARRSIARSPCTRTRPIAETHAKMGFHEGWGTCADQLGEVAAGAGAMRRVVARLFASLDGVMQAPGGPEEDPTGGFRLWRLVVPAIGTRRWASRWATASPGRSTCCSAARPRRFSPPTGPITEGGRRPVQRHHQICRHLVGRAARLGEQREARGRRADGVARLKQDDGPDLLTQGSAALVQLAARRRPGRRASAWLIFPVLLGHGKRWFGEASSAGRVDHGRDLTTTTGVIISRYRPNGPIRTGSFQRPSRARPSWKRRERMKAES